MKDAIVHALEPVTLLGGGEMRKSDIELVCPIAPRIIAADGGADMALAHGLTPEAVIGDIDSLSAAALAQLAPGTLHRIEEQDTTDFDKALRHIDAPMVLGLGFLGARLDHQLAALTVLARYPNRRVILVGASELVLHLPRRITLPTLADDVVSLMPLLPVTGRSAGLRWPIDGLTLSPVDRIGTSNAATGPVTLDLDGPGLIGIVPRARFRSLQQALRAVPPDALWPARA